ncbi:MAG: adenine phosphoribosyltransferase [Acidimicrobiales bacterium]
MIDFTALIRDVPDFPEPGIVFKDIMPLLADAERLRAVVTALADPWRDASLAAVVGIEARGFLLGTPVAMALGVGFIAVRKAGKLPGPTVQETYGLEYGTDTIEIHADAVSAGDHVLVLDDVLATGGTAAATAALLERLGASVAGFSFLLELGFLDGRARLGDTRIERLVLVDDEAGD